MLTRRLFGNVVISQSSVAAPLALPRRSGNVASLRDIW
jgi:hypothetical protein